MPESPRQAPAFRPNTDDLEAGDRQGRIIVAIEPAHGEAWRGLGVLAYRGGRLRRTVELLERAAHLAPDDAQLRAIADAFVGELLTRAGEEVDRAIDRGDGAAALAELAWIRRRHPELAAAGTAIADARDRLRARSRALTAAGQYLQASALDEALAAHADPEEARATRAHLDAVLLAVCEATVGVSDAGNHARAQRLGRRLMAFDPGRAFAPHALAVIDQRAGEPLRGLLDIARALALDPLAEGARSIAQSAIEDVIPILLDALRARRFDEADRVHRIILRADPGNSLAHRGLQLTALARPTPVRSEPEDGENLAVRQAEAEALVWLADRHRQAEELDQATALLTRAVEVAHLPEHLAQLADLHHLAALGGMAASLHAHVSAFLCDHPVATSRDRFHRLLPVFEDMLAQDGIDHRTRTRQWHRLCNLKALMAYGEALGGHPHIAPRPANPFAAGAIPAPGRRRVFDGFTFFNELEILEIRLRELYDVVEKFILVEARQTHSGLAKELVFEPNRARFEPWLDKIVHVVVDDLGDGFAWRREFQQRESIALGLEGCRDDDMILISDVDEIPRRGVVAGLTGMAPELDQVFTVEMDMHYYRLNQRFGRDWRAASAAPYRIVRQIGPNNLRHLARHSWGQVIPEAGWHFSWMGGAGRVVSKIRAYAHQEHCEEFAAESSHNERRIDRFFEDGGLVPRCLPGEPQGFEILAVDDRFPRLVREEEERWRRLGWLAE